MYPVKHFLSTILLAPIILEGFEQILYNQTVIGGLYFTFLALSFGFALPTYIVYHILYVQLKKQTIKPVVIKLILNFIAILGFLLTIKILQGSAVGPIILVYPLTILITSLLFNLSNENTGMPTTQATQQQGSSN